MQTLCFAGVGLILFIILYNMVKRKPAAKDAKKDYMQALNELRTLGGKIKSEHQ